MHTKRKNIVGAVLVAAVMAFVPLIVSAKEYDSGLSVFSWFSDSSKSYDFFLYWKVQALILLCGLTAGYIVLKILFFGGFREKTGSLGKPDLEYSVPAFVYLLTAALSTVFSSQRSAALWGGYEQWEGMVVIAVYVVFFFLANMIVTGRAEAMILAYGFLAGMFAISLLSVRQALGHDFFRTETGQKVMNFMLEKKLRFSFNFEVGRVYATLYNPNYVGSYVALALPVAASFLGRIRFRGIVRGKGRVLGVLGVLGAALQNLAAAGIVVMLIIMLLGSQSVTGCIGIVMTLLLFGVFMFGNRERRTWKLGLFSGLCVAAIVAAAVMNRPVFEYGIKKMTQPAPNRAEVTAMESRNGKLWIQTKDGEWLKLGVYIKNGVFQYEASDLKGGSAGIRRDDKSGKMKFDDGRFARLEIRETSVVAEGKEWPAIIVDTPSVGRSYVVVPQEEGSWVYKMYNPFKKLDTLEHIESFGFKDTQHFGSRRGYIWSRTFPLLKKHILLGSGPNTFIYEFPNNDYVGMKNVDYDGAVVTKPHNMYLQIFVQTGFLSLAAFLILYAVYFVQCIRTYWRRNAFSFIEKFGMGIWFGTFGYLVTGLANDSTVAVAPLYWCLLGAGFAVNRCIRANEMRNEVGTEDDLTDSD